MRNRSGFRSRRTGFGSGWPWAISSPAIPGA